eukprot:scaffold8008_cov34-Tisochrysis_lutea.AAC.6
MKVPRRLDLPSLSRRAAAHALAPLLVAALAPFQRSALAFDNRLPPDELELKYKSPRTPGPKPTDIGPRAGGGLKSCTDGKPHCFSSTPEIFEDEDLYNADYGTTQGWLVQPFRYEKPTADALAELRQVIAAYPPGQRGIDGGGFRVVSDKADADSAYVYVQFESMRKGYIDDVEFNLKGGVCNFRTSSRLGYLDLGVNAKRYNYFADALGERNGWNTVPLRSKGHEEYFSLNGVTDADMEYSGSKMVVKKDKTIV